MHNGDVALLENLRFQPGEEANDPEFWQSARQSLGDLYVNDAFGAAHRAHASTVGITKFRDNRQWVPDGKELKHLRDGLENPAKPFVVILGGSKVF
jgi:phosphoglycerate kinase